MITNHFFLPLLLVMFTPVAAWAIDNDSISIEFEDAAVKELCVEKWDTDGDGELSYEEAAAVTDISQAFWGKEITSFDELQYFTGLQSSGSWAFYNDNLLASIKLPENLTSIDDYFLCNCENLSSLEIPQNVSSIGIDAIKGCKSLKELIFPDSLKSFATSSIAECTSLESVQFSNSLTFIGDHAFHGCSSLSSIFIPRSVEQFGEAPFVYCNSVESISVDADNPHFDSRNNCNAVIRKEDNALILGCKNTIIPSTVRKIVLGAFAGHSDLQSITLNENITEIGEEAFAGCTNLSEITSKIRNPFAVNANVFTDVPNTAVLYVPNETKALYEATDGWKEFPGTIAEMEPEDSTIIAFADPAVKELCVANWDTDGDGELSYEEAAAVTDLGEVFRGNKNISSFDELKYFTGLKTIPEKAFYYCSQLSSVNIPSNVSVIGDIAFCVCSSLESIIVDKNNTFFDSRDSCNAIIKTRYNCLIVGCKNTIIPNSIQKIDYFAFRGHTGLTSITIPEGVKSIREYAFGECTNLSSISIPESLTELGWDAFGETAWYNSQPDGMVYLAHIAYNYKGDMPENTRVELTEGTKVIANGAFENRTNLTDIILPTSLRYIGAQAFDHCINLLSVNIPEGVSLIDFSAFEYTGLKSIVIPANATINTPFWQCNDLLSVTWYSTVYESLYYSSIFGIGSDKEKNANLLFYVNSNAKIVDENENIVTRNVIRDGQAEEIVLTDNEPVLIPEAFTAKEISYTHNFSKPTIPGTASGWESIVLPFDVQTITFEGETIVPFGSETSGYSKFWLADVSPDKGFAAATSMRANTPYIIAMPNSQAYQSGNITGSVTFTAADVTVQPTVNTSAECNAFSMVPCWSPIADTDSLYESIYLLNDEEYTSSTHTVYPPGSVFVRNLRTARPFEAYYIPAEGAGVKEFVPLDEAATAITSLYADSDSTVNVQCSSLFDLSGRRLQQSPRQGGLFITNGKLTAIDGKTTNHSKIQQ